MLEGQINECIDDICRHANNPDREALIDGFEILYKLMSNCASNPSEDKYKTIKTSNKTIQAKVMCI